MQNPRWPFRDMRTCLIDTSVHADPPKPPTPPQPYTPPREPLLEMYTPPEQTYVGPRFVRPDLEE